MCLIIEFFVVIIGKVLIFYVRRFERRYARDSKFERFEFYC